MPRRGASITQADVARVLRAYRSEGLKVNVRLMPDGSMMFEPIATDSTSSEDDDVGRINKEIVL
jgi:hypothetical protein